MEQENNNKEADNPVEKFANSLALEKRNEETVEAAAKAQSFEMNNGGAGLLGKAPAKAESSKKRTPKSLKAKSKINKGPPDSITLKGEKANDNQQSRGRNRRRRNKGLLKRENNNNEFEKNTNQNLREDKLPNNSKGKEIEKNQGMSASSSKSQRNQKTEDAQFKNPENQKNKGKLDAKDKSQGDQKKAENLGGLIFMCNAKTKADCFRYQIMGVTSGKKDLVLGVKPGLKLFLFDFDLRLMYGIYKASSSGGMKLEPKAFGGSFPVQVRFSVHKDCVPLPESVFKKAIKDNYVAKNKFEIELTVRQVRKLSELFRPVAFQSLKPAAIPVFSAPVATIRDREVYEKLRDSRPHSDMEERVRDDGRSYPVLFRERDPREVVSTHREEAPRDLYMSEKEYRTYGLQRERRNPTPPRRAVSTLDPYSRNPERESLLRQPAPIYGDTVSAHRELVLADPLYSTPREFHKYDMGGRSDIFAGAPSVSAMPSGSTVTALDPYRRDPYQSYQYGTSSASAYLLPPNREEAPSSSYYIDGRRETYLNEPDPLQRREADSVDQLYLKYGVEPLAQYKPVYQEAKPETVRQLVSSRYSFAGPSVSYR
ncbi:uncharacterized protein LOC126673104 [Mercurialis annua]|uniref:uncharacterized protein LOC126673104 n=1 Tax=Mercurialis annua TaxID=3986 RepID=UPI00215E9E72|nr:uncharacterized protein LOC126673104 [Mercurialis annua]XP_050223046.1 uncharacterized protein LOC126673104 [Mercurialis annua]